MCPSQVYNENKYAPAQTGYGQEYTTNKLPIPGNYKNYQQNKRWNKIHQKCSRILNKVVVRGEGVQRKHADKQNSKDADDPRQPVKYFS